MQCANWFDVLSKTSNMNYPPHTHMHVSEKCFSWSLIMCCQFWKHWFLTHLRSRSAWAQSSNADYWSVASFWACFWQIFDIFTLRHNQACKWGTRRVYANLCVWACLLGVFVCVRTSMCMRTCVMVDEDTHEWGTCDFRHIILIFLSAFHPFHVRSKTHIYITLSCLKRTKPSH